MTTAADTVGSRHGQHVGAGIGFLQIHTEPLCLSAVAGARVKTWSCMMGTTALDRMPAGYPALVETGFLENNQSGFQVTVRGIHNGQTSF